MALFNERLRVPSVYSLAVYWSFRIGARLALLRMGCIAVVAATFLACRGLVWSWWFLAVALAATGSLLAWLHPQEDRLQQFADSRVWPARVVFRHMLGVAGKAGVSLPGFLEGISPFVLAYGIGSPSGPLAKCPAPFLVAAVAVLLYAVTSVGQWLYDSTYYVPVGGVPTGLAKLFRGILPLLGAGVYSILLYRNADAALAPVPLFAATAFLALYPILALYDGLLEDAELQRTSDIQVARWVAASTVHAYLSPPLFFLTVAARSGSTERLTGTLIDVRARLRGCMDEIIAGEAPPGELAHIIEELRRFLPESERNRLQVDPMTTVGRLSGPDFTIARRVLADLCSNGLKAGGDLDNSTTVTILVTRRPVEDQPRSIIHLQVQDNGPSIQQAPAPASSLTLLQQTLDLNQGGLTLDPRPEGGTIAVAWWLGDLEDNDEDHGHR